MTVATLDATAKQDVKYAVPLWQRDEQIKHAIATVPGRIAPVAEARTEPVAVVGFGASLQATWERVRDFKYVITCSGSHRFLIDRGIVPTWHVEVDPRPHKVGLLGAPHPDVEYLPASACAPEYFAHLAGYNVKLWHVFDSTDEGIRTLPPGEWAVTGGCDVGLRAMTIAAFFGFRDLHVFGLDGSAPAPDAPRHAGDHPNGRQKYATTEYNSKTYWTTPAMLEAARQMRHEMDQMPGVKATFYGEGLVQDMMRGYKPKPVAPGQLVNVIAFAKDATISAEYAELNARLHRDNFAYGVGGEKHAETVLKLVDATKARSVLDYGCGKGTLGKALPFGICEYDPAIPGKTESPRPADLVVCTDVLEHIEPEKLGAVLRDLHRVTRKVGFFVIHTTPAVKKLADGRNTHLIVEGRRWWEKRLQKFFKIGKIVDVKAGDGTLVELRIVVGPKGKAA
jgi:6-hydroxymethylpterin diphosphokinase MptE-like protein/methyltransferase family protein